MTATRPFHVGGILSVITPHMVSPDGLDGIRDLLSWMTGDRVLLWPQYPRVAAECAPSLREQFPDLAALTLPPEVLSDRETGLAWLARLPGGETREVAPLAPEDHTSIDPLTELQMRAPGAGVIAVVVPDGDQP